jgi:catechol 2,3-dioxygenase-like lactoylglutathione lyase family enzyme
MSSDTTSDSGARITGGSPTVFVSDLDRAVDFYTNVLGLRLQYRAGEHFAMIDAGAGLSIGLHPPGRMSPSPGTAGCIQLGFSISGPIESVVQALQARGVTFKERDGSAIVDDGAVKLAFFGDPDGTELYLCEVPGG